MKFHKLKLDASLPVESQVFPSRQKSIGRGILLEGTHAPSDVGHLDGADPKDWPKVLKLLQGWGWGGNIPLASMITAATEQAMAFPTLTGL